MVSKTCLTPGDHLVANDGAASDSDLARKDTVLANFYVMSNLNKVIDFISITDLRDSGGGAVNRGQGTNINLITDNDLSYLGNSHLLRSIPVVSKSGVSKDGSGTNFAVHSNRNIPKQNRVRENCCFGTDDTIFAEVTKWHDLGASSDGASTFDHHVGSD